MLPWLISFLLIAAAIGVAIFKASPRVTTPLAADPTAPVASTARTDPAPSPEPRALRWGRALGIVMGFFGVCIAVSVTISAVVGVVALTEGLNRTAILRTIRLFAPAPAVVLNYIVGSFFVVRWVQRTLGLPNWREALRAMGGSWGTRRANLLGAATGLLGAVLALLFIRWGGPPPKFSPRSFPVLIGHPGWRRDLWIVSAVLLAPPIEEFLFRGVLLTGFTRSAGKVVAAVAVTILFVAFHLPSTRGWWPALLGITMMATASVIARLWTGSLGPSVAMHAAYNLAVSLRLVFFG